MSFGQSRRSLRRSGIPERPGGGQSRQDLRFGELPDRQEREHLLKVRPDRLLVPDQEPGFGRVV